jgi:hypothetical protein
VPCYSEILITDMNIADPNFIDDGSPLEYYTTMKRKWPTLEGRLNHPLTSRGEALRQMKNNGDVLSLAAEKDLEKYENLRKRQRKGISARVK